MTSSEIRSRFLAFFAARGHAILPSASLVPKNDPSVLFNTAGMQPLVPYLMGEPHPQGTRLVNVQKCVRTQDIEEVGDKTHDTFFEMLGNWSLGDYFKEDAIIWSYEFLTSKEEGLGLDAQRLYVTVFEGDENAPRDEESYEIWKTIFERNGITGERIYFMGAESNWWSVGDNGPCGPDTEMFYDLTGEYSKGLTKEQYMQLDEEQKVVEIWNDVFMEYVKKDGVVVGKLQNKNVDTGSGLERVVMAVQGKDNIFETDLFSAVMDVIHTAANNYEEKRARIVADHIRTAVLLVSDGVLPGNKDQGYILRRLIRRAAVQARALGLTDQVIIDAIALFIIYYKENYPDVATLNVSETILGEIGKFKKTLEGGLIKFDLKTGVKNLSTNEKVVLELNGKNLFDLWTTDGFPPELSIEIAEERGIPFSKDAVMIHFNTLMKAHQDASRAGAEQKFKGGLANTSEVTTKLHTAHHLLLAALQAVVSPDIHQKGSNITEERLRIDFNFDRKLTDEEKTKVEAWVNEVIARDLQVVRREMPKADAENIGAEMEFGTTYPNIVSVYSIEDKDGSAVSKEFCGGPHVTHTGDLGVFRIQKEEASSAGVRRIKAILG